MNLLNGIFSAGLLVLVLFISGCDNRNNICFGASYGAVCDSDPPPVIGGDHSPVIERGVRPWGMAPPVVVVPITFDILSFADAGGGNITVSTPNVPNAGDLVLINGTANYDGTYTASNVTGASFDVTAAFAGTETGFWQLAGGAIAGCNTTGDTGVINLVNNTSRFEGAAPLAVFFDASATDTIPSTPRPFTDLGYSWNFGDQGPSAGTWPTGNKPGVSSRNVAIGPMAAHVFQSPGTYTVTLNVTDGANTVSNACVRIAVLDPEVVFAGDNTICFSTSGDFTDVPPGTCAVAGIVGTPGATAIQTNDFSVAVNTYQATGKRLLFRRGEIWNATAPAIIREDGPGLVGSFGTVSTRPRIVNTTDLSKIIKISTPSTPGIGDWRIMDLDIDGGGSPLADTTSGIGGGGGTDQVTILRVDIRNLSTGFSFDGNLLDVFNAGANPGHTIYDQLAISDSFAYDMVGSSGSNGMFLYAKRLMLLGNTIVNTASAEHNIRVQFMDNGVIQNSTFTQASETKALLTVRAAPFGNTGVTSPGVTSKVVISDNLYKSVLQATPITIWPSSETQNQRINNVIFERNFFLGDSATETALSVSASEVTARNNIFNMTGATAKCMSFSRRGTLIPIQEQIRVYNNTCFSDSVHGLRMVILGEGLDTVIIKNNLASAINSTGAVQFLEDRGVGGTPNLVGNGGTFGNSSDVDITNTDTNFVNGSGSYLLPADFNLGAGPAIDAGLAFPADLNAPPVVSDFFLLDRPVGASTDMGATEQ